MCVYFINIYVSILGVNFYLEIQIFWEGIAKKGTVTSPKLFAQTLLMLVF